MTKNYTNGRRLGVAVCLALLAVIAAPLASADIQYFEDKNSDGDCRDEGEHSTIHTPDQTDPTVGDIYFWEGCPPGGG